MVIKVCTGLSHVFSGHMEPLRSHLGSSSGYSKPSRGTLGLMEATLHSLKDNLSHHEATLRPPEPSTRSPFDPSRDYFRLPRG